MHPFRATRGRRPARPLRSQLARAVDQAVLFVVTFGIVIGGLSLRGHGEPTRDAQAGRSIGATRIGELTDRHDCSRTGLGPDVIPAHAIVLTPDSRVRLTSFDHGWRVLEGDRPGTLLAVCRR
jgi:hypothetical protein